jgi:hypothetical protein
VEGFPDASLDDSTKKRTRVMKPRRAKATKRSRKVKGKSRNRSPPLTVELFEQIRTVRRVTLSPLPVLHRAVRAP